MSRKGQAVRPVSQDVIQNVVAKMREEVMHPDYVVASSVDIDWCPCCGINFRLRDVTGRMIAKFIAPTPFVARDIAVDLLAMSARAAEIEGDADIRARAMDEVFAAGGKTGAAS